MLAPNRIVSLWDLIELQTDMLAKSIGHLASYARSIEIERDALIANGVSQVQIPEDVFVASVVAALKFKEASELAGLGAGPAADRLIDHLKRTVKLREALPVHELRAMAELMNQLVWAITDGLSERKVFALSGAHAAYYDGPALFGDAVENAFPSSSPEISEAGKCRATARWTACVMHLMRALEPALLALQADVGASSPKEQWHQVIDQIEAAIGKIKKHTHGKDDEKWYSEAAIHFKLIKNAWRNYSQHLHERYDEERAVEIFDSTRAFMRHLATRLSE